MRQPARSDPARAGSARGPSAGSGEEFPDATAEAILAGNGPALVEAAQRLADQLSRGGVRAAQLRQLYNSIRRLRTPDSWELSLFRARLAYAVARAGQRRVNMRPLESALLALLDRVGEDLPRFRRFQDFFEALVAYHAVTAREEG